MFINVLFTSRRSLDDGMCVPFLNPCIAQADLTVKPSVSKGYLQAVDKAGNPLCLRCQQPTCQTKQECKVNAWESRFCSLKCQEEFWIRSNNNYLRAKVFEIEHGVCQLCNLNAQELFLRLRDAPKSQRKALLDFTWISKLPLEQVNLILWQREGSIVLTHFLFLNFITAFENTRTKVERIINPYTHHPP